jgi:hypothetical protein
VANVSLESLRHRGGALPVILPGSALVVPSALRRSSRARATILAQASGSAITSRSQKRSSIHPREARAAPAARSLAMFRAIFSFQYVLAPGRTKAG